ncbi:MAG: hypothetical protein QME96_06845 [Myxococcota bacterium]|nr:hypothetical protein [Myxococcota bacterium]
MPDARKLALFCEGHDDYAVLEWLVQHGHLPAELDSCRPPKGDVLRGGADGMIGDVVPWLKTGVSALVVRDIDDLDLGGVVRWFEKSIADHRLDAKQMPEPEACPPGVLFFHVTAPTAAARPARVAVVAVGDPTIAKLTPCCDVTRFAVDDYLLRLLVREDVYGAISELKDAPHTKAFAKLARFAASLRDNGLPVQTSKRVLGLLHGITGFRASPTEFAKRVLDNAKKALPAAELAAVIESLVEPLRFAARTLL